MYGSTILQNLSIQNIKKLNRAGIGRTRRQSENQQREGEKRQEIEVQGKSKVLNTKFYYYSIILYLIRNNRKNSYMIASHSFILFELLLYYSCIFLLQYFLSISIQQYIIKLQQYYQQFIFYFQKLPNISLYFPLSIFSQLSSYSILLLFLMLSKLPKIISFPAPLRLQPLLSPRNHSSFHPRLYDLFIYLNNQIVPLVRSYFADCRLIINQSSNILFIEEAIDIRTLKKVVDLFYGGSLQISTMKELEQYLNVFDLLQAKPYIDEIQTQIEKDLQEYDIFCILEIAFKYGMQKIFDLCFWYLQCDQFQQIKYNKFDLLQCNFKLFQIILRRHHLLKMKGEIQGIDLSDIQEVIRLYCHRHHLHEEALQRLLNKYIHNFEKNQKVKTSLRLDKLAHKKILQSANIDTDFYDNQQGTQFEGLKHFRGDVTSIDHREKKQIIHFEKLQRKSQMMQKNQNSCPQIQQPDAESFFQDEDEDEEDEDQRINLDNENEKEIEIFIKEASKKSGEIILQSLEREQNKLTVEKQDKHEEEPSSLMLKISGFLLNQYEEALTQHDQKYRRIRRNSKSMLFQNFKSSIHDELGNGNLLNSSNIKQNLLFTIDEGGL